MRNLYVLCGILLLTTPALAQDTKPGGAATKAEHSTFGPGGQKAEHITHPDAQWYPDAPFGLFIHWDISSVGAMNIQLARSRSLGSTACWASGR